MSDPMPPSIGCLSMPYPVGFEFGRGERVELGLYSKQAEDDTLEDRREW